MQLALATPITALVTTIVGGNGDAFTQVELTSGERIVITIPAALRDAYQHALPALERTRPVLTLAIAGTVHSLHSVESRDVMIRDGFTTHARSAAEPVAAPRVRAAPLRRAA